jgi:response regulator RpfG family c-di-GMP phosphodiesterase
MDSPVKAKPRILLLDDEDIVLQTLRDTLVEEGYEVLGHTEPLKALGSLTQETFGVVLTDQRMPNMSGLEFLAKVRQVQPNATRMLTTGVVDLETVIDSINKGEIFRFIAKPWVREELLATMHNAVQRYELICQNELLQTRTTEMNKELQAQVERVGQQNQELARLNQALGENLQHTAELCLQMLETYSPVLGNQTRRVFHLCSAMAKALDLKPAQKQALELSAWLHDMGMIGVPQPLIKRWQNDPSALSEFERNLIQQHPVLGQELARFTQPLQDVGQIIRCHHERFDGQGFPDQLAGESIPWLARLLAVAVGFAASKDTPADAAKALEHEQGNAYDPQAVRVLLGSLPRSSLPRREIEVLLPALRPGMILARGIYSAHGMLLVPGGQRLTQEALDKVRNHNALSPLNQELLVYH